MTESIKKAYIKLHKWLTYDIPDALTLNEWDEFYENFKKNAPVRYFFVVFLYRKLLPIQYDIGRAFDKLRYRTTKKYHLIDTKLKPDYYEKDTLMLHGCFSLLVDYVEVECAHMAFCGEEYDGGVVQWSRYPWLKKRWFRWVRHPKRSRKWGINHLDWAATLDDPKHTHHDLCHGQAEAARKVKELYIWWKDIRPNREYPSNPAEHVPIRNIINGNLQKDDPDLYKKYREYSDEINRIEIEWDEEDDEMLAKLVAIRKELWT